MNLINFFKDYKDYIESNNSHSLVLSKSKGRNLFRFIQLQNFQKKYGDLLYKHFKVMDSPDEYEFLFDYFGKKTLETAMQNERRISPLREIFQRYAGIRGAGCGMRIR